MVGQCCARYVEVVRERVAATGMQPARDVIWLQGCPPDVGEIRAALARIVAQEQA
jgi:coenzyme F420-reducing hydrogenase gamma subunit